MKFSGLHFHMVLVIALICVIVYIFYVSKDIVTIDNEVRNLKIKVDNMQRQLGNSQVCTMKTNLQSQEISNEKLPQKTSVEIANNHPQIDDDVQSVDSEKIRKLISNIQQTAESENDKNEGIVSDVQPDDAPAQGQEKEMTLNEIKELCKQNGISTKGNKKQLVELLKTNGIVA